MFAIIAVALQLLLNQIEMYNAAIQGTLSSMECVSGQSAPTAQNTENQGTVNKAYASYLEKIREAIPTLRELKTLNDKALVQLQNSQDDFQMKKFNEEYVSKMTPLLSQWKQLEKQMKAQQETMIHAGIKGDSIFVPLGLAG